MPDLVHPCHTEATLVVASQVVVTHLGGSPSLGPPHPAALAPNGQGIQHPEGGGRVKGAGLSRWGGRLLLWGLCWLHSWLALALWCAVVLAPCSPLQRSAARRGRAAYPAGASVSSGAVAYLRCIPAVGRIEESWDCMRYEA